jgi:hypothetical protein
MGVCLAVIFDKKFPEADAFSDFTDGKIIVYNLFKLDTLAERSNVDPLSKFAPDYDPDVYNGPPIDEQWFEIADGLKTISAILSALESAPDQSGLSKTEAQDVTEDLAELHRVLTESKRANARFYLLYC